MPDMQVSLLWDNRMTYCSPRKRNHMDMFFNSFTEVLENVKGGKEYTTDEIEASDYYQNYIRRIHRGGSRDPMSRRLRRHCIGMFEDSVRLYHDIRENGLKRPLDYYDPGNGTMHLWKGYRRLTIVKALGYETVGITIHSGDVTNA